MKNEIMNIKKYFIYYYWNENQNEHLGFCESFLVKKEKSDEWRE